MMAEQVECRSEFSYAERPVALIWEGNRLLVSEVLISVRIPEGMRFRVLTEDERVFELVYDQARDTWLVWLV